MQKLIRTAVVILALVGATFGLGWIKFRAPARTSEQVASAVNERRWDDLYELTKKPRDLKPPWSKETFVHFCSRYLSEKTTARVSADTQTSLFGSKIWAVTLSSGSVREAPYVGCTVFLNPTGDRRLIGASIVSNSWDLDCLLAFEHLLILAAQERFPKEVDSDVATLKFLIEEHDNLVALGMRSTRTASPTAQAVTVAEEIQELGDELIKGEHSEEVRKLIAAFKRSRKELPRA